MRYTSVTVVGSAVFLLFFTEASHPFTRLFRLRFDVLSAVLPLGVIVDQPTAIDRLPFADLHKEADDVFGDVQGVFRHAFFDQAVREVVACVRHCGHVVAERGRVGVEHFHHGR